MRRSNKNFNAKGARGAKDANAIKLASFAPFASLALRFFNAKDARDSRGGGKFEPELDMLSQILKTFNELFGALFSESRQSAARYCGIYRAESRGR